MSTPNSKPQTPKVYRIRPPGNERDLAFGVWRLAFGVDRLLVSCTHDPRTDSAFVPVGSDRRHTEHVVVDVHVGQHVLSDGANRDLVFPVGRPGLAPEDAVAGSAL